MLNIKVTVVLLFLFMLYGCQVGTRPRVLENEQSRLCVPITHISEVLPVFAIERDTDRDLALQVPKIPVKLKAGGVTDRSVIMLAEKFSQDNVAINGMLYTATMLRNAAPCNEINIIRSWDFMEKALDVMLKRYGREE